MFKQLIYLKCIFFRRVNNVYNFGERILLCLVNTYIYDNFSHTETANLHYIYKTAWSMSDLYENNRLLLSSSFPTFQCSNS